MLALLLNAMRFIPPVVAAIPQIKALLDDSISKLNIDDQATAKAAYEDLMQDNDEGFARLDAKLAEAEQR